MFRLIRKAAWSAAIALLAGVIVAPVWAQEKPADKPAPPVAAPVVAEGPAIDLVICLDVSGSMNGLMDSAKMRLWDIVNELAKLKPTPNLRVGLYSYGHSNYAADKGYVRKDMDLTVDLDDVYKALNTLTIGGGTELVARVSKTAIEEQKWSTEKGAMKLMFVCGNEAADQDTVVPLDDVAALAKKNDIFINTIYCKYGRDEEIAAWAKFSEKCGGKHMVIDQNKAVKQQQVVVKTEFDDQIIKLGDELNKTFVAFGRDGKARAENQVAQDANAAKALPGAAAGAPQEAAIARAATKAGEIYRNGAATWDLVSKLKEKDFDITKVKEEDLCDDLKKLKPEERLAFLKKKADERAELQKKIADLTAKRTKKVDEELAKKPKTEGDKALDEAVKGIIRDQAKAKGFEIPSEKK